MFKEKALLLRDCSEESEEAEKMLKNYSVDFCSLFCTDGRLPSVISPDSAYAFEGIGNIRIFVSNLKLKK